MSFGPRVGYDVLKAGPGVPLCLQERLSLDVHSIAAYSDLWFVTQVATFWYPRIQLLFQVR